MAKLSYRYKYTWVFVFVCYQQRLCIVQVLQWSLKPSPYVGHGCWFGFVPITKASWLVPHNCNLLLSKRGIFFLLLFNHEPQRGALVSSCPSLFHWLFSHIYSKWLIHSQHRNVQTHAGKHTQSGAVVWSDKEIVMRDQRVTESVWSSVEVTSLGLPLSTLHNKMECLTQAQKEQLQGVV